MGGIYMELYEKIVFLRRKNGLSQQELADKLEISRQSVYKWEQGLTSPDITKLPELAKIFNVTVDELLNNDIDEKELAKDKVIENLENKNAYNKFLEIIKTQKGNIEVLPKSSNKYDIKSMSEGYL